MDAHACHGRTRGIAEINELPPSREHLWFYGVEWGGEPVAHAMVHCPDCDSDICKLVIPIVRCVFGELSANELGAIARCRVGAAARRAA